MNKRDIDSLYRAFGKLVQRNRKRQPGLTQEKLGEKVNLSRTSITNIEKGRQHIALHQLFAIAEALKTRPEALLPAPVDVTEALWLAEKLPPGTSKELTDWAAKVVGD
jgi:transcriptional regulator with XRE-family HTH domain